MSNQKITQFTSINWASVDAANDVLPIIDVSDPTMSPSGTNKKITAQQLLSSKQDALGFTPVPQTRTLTINGTTQDLSANRTFTIPISLTVGSTAITSGTVGRILFEGTGNVLQQDSALFWDNTNKRLGVGASPASTVRLDVRAQGALSTDVAFRVRNSADSSNLTSIDGTGLITSANSLNVTLTNFFNITRPLVQDNGNNILTTYSRVVDNNVFVGFGNTLNTGIENSSVLGHSNTIGINAQRNSIVGIQNSSTGNINTILGRFFSNTGNNNILIGSRATLNRGVDGSNFIWLGHGNESNAINCSSALFTYFDVQANPNHILRRRGNIALLGEKYQIISDANTSTGLGSRMDLNAENTFTVHNGTAPSVNITDAFQQYSADITAGNAAPHFRTENGNIIKIYQETTGVAAATLVGGGGTTITDTDTFDGYTMKQVVKALRNLGILA